MKTGKSTIMKMILLNTNEHESDFKIEKVQFDQGKGKRKWQTKFQKESFNWKMKTNDFLLKMQH